MGKGSGEEKWGRDGMGNERRAERKVKRRRKGEREKEITE